MASDKKQIPLRLSSDLYGELMKWAEDDFRSVNGQIEYLLTQCVKQHKKNGAMIPVPVEAEEDEIVQSAMRQVKQKKQNK